jgi:hypothetical protein
MTRVFDRLLDTLLPTATAEAACSYARNEQCSVCVQSPFTPPQQFCRFCERLSNCRTYCAYFFRRC